jgi:hypothetical protein
MKTSTNSETTVAREDFFNQVIRPALENHFGPDIYYRHFSPTRVTELDDHEERGLYARLFNAYFQDNLWTFQGKTYRFKFDYGGTDYEITELGNAGNLASSLTRRHQALQDRYRLALIALVICSALIAVTLNNTYYWIAVAGLVIVSSVIYLHFFSEQGKRKRIIKNLDRELNRLAISKRRGDKMVRLDFSPIPFDQVDVSGKNTIMVDEPFSLTDYHCEPLTKDNDQYVQLHLTGTGAITVGQGEDRAIIETRAQLTIRVLMKNAVVYTETLKTSPDHEILLEVQPKTGKRELTLVTGSRKTVIVGDLLVLNSIISADDERPTFTVCGEVFEKAYSPKTYSHFQKDPEYFQKKVKSVADAWHNGNISSAMQALESDL